MSKPAAKRGTAKAKQKKKPATAKKKAAAKKATTSKSRKIVPAATDIMATVNVNLVTQAAEDITGILRRTRDRGMREVGAYILKTFYENDIETYQSKSPTKHASLRALVDKCGTYELPISKTFLQNSIGVAIVERQLGKGDHAFSALPPSHQASVLPLREPEKIEEMAAKARSNEMTVRDVRQEVQAELRKNKEPSRAGRKPKHPVVKIFDGAMRLLKRDRADISFLAGELKTLKDEDLGHLITNVKVVIAGLSELLDKLQEMERKREAA